MRLAHSLTRLAGPFSYSLAVGAVGFAYLSPSATAGRPAPVAYRPAASRLRVERTAACKGLSVSKQVQAVKDFAAMLPVFRHPRCNNCHGGLNPLTEQHRGFDQLDLSIDRMASPESREKWEAQCQDCHTELKGWTIPGEPLFFDGKSDEDLCKQMKRFEKTGDLFVEHLLNDHKGIQFIAAGFKGDRALGEDGLKDYDLVAEPPPGTQGDLTAKAQKWVDDLKEHYGDSEDCGCVVPKIRLEIHNAMERNIPNGLPSKEASDLKFEVSLLPLGEDKPGGYQGDVDVVRRVQVTVPGNCAVKGNTINEHWTFFAILQPDSDSMQVWHIQIPNDDQDGEIGCMVRPSGGWGGRRLSGKTDTVKTEEQWTQSMLANAEPFMMPSDSGATKEFTDGEAGDFEQESLSITVLAVPK